MTDDLEIRQRLLAGPDIVGQLGDRYFTALAAQIAADTDPLPRIVLTGDTAGGTTIRIVEGVTLVDPPRRVDFYRVDCDDLPIMRGFIWYAMVGDLMLHATRRTAGSAVPCRIVGTLVATSTRSAQDALDRARQSSAWVVTP